MPNGFSAQRTPPRTGSATKASFSARDPEANSDNHLSDPGVARGVSNVRILGDRQDAFDPAGIRTNPTNGPTSEHGEVKAPQPPKDFAVSDSFVMHVLRAKLSLSP